MAKFRRFLHEAARDAGVNVTQMKSLPPPEDFPPVPGFEPHLKCVVLRLG
jgi:23S rRNA (cytosine1962-C5)-methyltransferase